MSRLAAALWLAVAAFACAGIVSGAVASARAARPLAAPSPEAPAQAATRAAFVLASAPEAQDGADADPVVVERSPSPNADGSARIALVVGPGGSSALDAAFARLDLPIAIAIDPASPGAARAAALARDAGKPFVLQLRGMRPASAALLARRFPDAAGFFDERGDADPALYARAGVTLVRRDLTVDRRSEPGYVGFMLERALALGASRGTAVAWMHPRVTSLAALRAFAQRHGRDVVGLQASADGVQ